MTIARPDAVELLEADHRACERLFAEYRDLVRHEARPAQRKALANRLCLELTVHAKLEEELFYPAAREALHEDDAIDDAESAHESVKDLVAQLLASRAEDPLFDAKVAVLEDYVARHVREERDAVFPQVRRSPLDLHALARSMNVRKAELRAVADALLEDALASTVA
jgi:hypothetical protein